MYKQCNQQNNQTTKQPDNKTTRQQNNQTTKQPDNTNVFLFVDILLLISSMLATCKTSEYQ